MAVFAPEMPESAGDHRYGMFSGMSHHPRGLLSFFELPLLPREGVVRAAGVQSSAH
jgi:hypothetical protein